MCLMICLPPGKRADATVMDAIRTGLQVNADGIGFCVADIKGSPIGTKYFGGTGLDEDATEKVIAGFSKLRDMYPEGPAMIHLRWGTSGERNLENVQPWPLDHAIVAMGGVYFDVEPGEQRSDAKIIAGDLEHSQLDLPEVRDLIEQKLPPRCSMVVFSHGQHHILGEDQGFWHQDAWYSSSDFIQAPPVLADSTGWADRLTSIEARQLYRKLGNALTHGPDLDMETYLEINQMRGELLVAHPQMSTGSPQ